MTDEELDRLVDVRATRARAKLIPGEWVPGTRYRIVGWLGDGGTGVVYEATHEDLGRKVAIKVLHAEHSEDPEIVATFREEARAATKIGSPYIVEVIDFAELPDGRLLYVMERLRGCALDRDIARAPMPLPRFFGILRQVCKGLGSAHEAGLVHRDIKPEHIFVIDAGEPQAAGRVDRIKIMDFGIAAVVGHSGDIQGTPSYMPPEQVQGTEVAPQNDVYSLGCTAYELLVGHPPFRGESLREVLRKHVREEPVPPSELAGKEVVPPAVEAVILRCLAKDRAARFSNMRELEAALLEAQLEAGVRTPWDDLPVPDVEPTRKAALEAGLQRLRERHAVTPRRRWAALSLFAVLLAASGALLAGRYLWTPEAQGAPVEVASRVDELAAEAKDAAAKASFVYPPVDDPDAATAYHKVIELEALAGPERELALERARALREEFADTLERLGDRYWQTENGRAFAVDYYAQAVMFDSERQRARERGAMTPGEMSELRRKADQSDFTPTELEAAEPLSVLATDDDSQRQARMAQWIRKRDQAGASFIRDSRFEQLLRNLGEVEFPASEAARDPEPTTEPAPRLAALELELLALEAIAPAPPPEAAPARPEAPVSSRRDPEAATALAQEGQEALRRGRWVEASKLFHAALDHDRRCDEALIGLSDLYFEQADHPNAVKYARLAIGAEPGEGSYRIKYGDALVKVLEYSRARTQYERAVKLGHPSAEERLSRLDEKIGR